MRVSGRSEAALRLRDIGTARGPLNIPGGGGDWTAEDKRKNIDVVKGAIRDAFEPDPGSHRDAARFGLASHLERILQNSVTEQSLFELKQGLLTLGATRGFDEGPWEKIPHSITAIANVGPYSTGYLVIGVADSEKDVQRIHQLDGIKPVKSRSNRFDAVGIEREAAVRGESLKGYFDRVSDSGAGVKVVEQADYMRLFQRFARSRA